MHPVEASAIDRIRLRSSVITPQPSSLPPQLTIPYGTKAVIFDIYGTLFSSSAGEISFTRCPDPPQALQKALGFLNITVESSIAEKLYHTLVKEISSSQDQARKKGVMIPEIDIRHIWEKILAPLGLSQVDPAALALEFELQTNPVWPMPDAEMVIRTLHRHGISLGIISNAQFYTPLLFPAFFHKSTEELGFSHCIWSYHYQVAKPDPLLFTRIRELFWKSHNITAAQILYVGNDMLNDVWGGYQQGFKTALFAGDAQSLRMRENEPRTREIYPDCIITNLKQLLKIVEGI